MTLSISDKILISCVSAMFIAMIWIAKPPNELKKRALLGVSDGRALSYLRPVLSAVIAIVNIVVWLIR